MTVPKQTMLLVAAVVAVMCGAQSATAEASPSVHAGVLNIPDFDAITMCHLPAPQDDYFNPYNPNNEHVKIFGMPRFHKAHGEAHHTDQDPENPSVKSKKSLTRIGSVSSKLYANNIGQVLEICPGAAQPILRGQLATDRLRTVFDTMDKDGDGDLELEDIRECFERMNLKKSEKEVKELFTRMDVDQDHKITFHDFEKAIHLVAASAGDHGLLEKLQLHPGTWIRHIPDHIPNLEIEPRNYGAQWIGEDRLGGGWSSDNCPLSGDRPKGMEELLAGKDGTLKVATLTCRGRRMLLAVRVQNKKITKDAEGNLHEVAKKGTDSGVDAKSFLHPLSSSLLI